MTIGRYRFDRFVLDSRDRRLRRDGEPIELNSRYFDALALLLSEAGQLVSKDRFLEQVWRGVPVTDEALTQCVRTLRRQLGDDAAAPRFIETVPKHGYRFIAAVERTEDSPGSVAARTSWRETLLLGAAGTIGGGLAGFCGGMVYGFAGASQPLQPGMGAVSVLLVILCLCIAVAVMGAAGVSFGIALAGKLGRHDGWMVMGGALGGLVIGAAVKLLGVDAFNLLVGQSPGDITGAGEGAVLGAAVGLGAWFARDRSLRRGMAVAAVCGGVAGALLPLLGGRMMAGSLALLAESFPESRLRLDELGRIFGEPGFGPITASVTGALEGGLFSAGIIGAMVLARRNLADPG